jgi:hypothetical protein
MALSILSSLFSKAQFTIKDGTSGLVVAANAKIVSVRIRYSSRVHRHMLENGSTVVDARTILPTHLQVELICPDIDTLAQITDVAMNRTGVYSISSKGLIFDNMMVEDQCISQIPKMLSASPLRLEFKEQLVQYVLPVVFAQSADASLIDRGFAALNSVTTQVSDVATRLTTIL